MWGNAKTSNMIVQTDYNVANGLGEAIWQKQKQMTAGDEKEQIVFIIKPLASSSYQNIISALDEVLINNVQHYAVVDVTAEEKAFLEKKQ
jgi:hypothetical protein